MKPLVLNTEEYAYCHHEFVGHFKRLQRLAKERPGQEKTSLFEVYKSMYAIFAAPVVQNEIKVLTLNRKKLRVLEDYMTSAQTALTERIIPGYMERIEQAPEASEKERLKVYLDKAIMMRDTFLETIKKKVGECLT